MMMTASTMQFVLCWSCDKTGNNLVYDDIFFVAIPRFNSRMATVLTKYQFAELDSLQYLLEGA